eukprot:gene12812-biopygen9518
MIPAPEPPIRAAGIMVVRPRKGAPFILAPFPAPPIVFCGGWAISKANVEAALRKRTHRMHLRWYSSCLPCVTSLRRRGEPNRCFNSPIYHHTACFVVAFVVADLWLPQKLRCLSRCSCCFRKQKPGFCPRVFTVEFPSPVPISCRESPFAGNIPCGACLTGSWPAGLLCTVHVCKLKSQLQVRRAAKRGCSRGSEWAVHYTVQRCSFCPATFGG